MSITDTAGRAPRTSVIAAALAKQKKDIRRGRRRAHAAWKSNLKRTIPSSVIAAGAKPLRMLQAILGHADVIALDSDKTGPQRVHMLVTLPAYLLDQATALAAIDEDDEDTDGGEDDQDNEPPDDDEASLGACDDHTDQSRWGCEGTGLPRDHAFGWGNAPGDLELDYGYEPAPRRRKPAALHALDPDSRIAKWVSIGSRR